MSKYHPLKLTILRKPKHSTVLILIGLLVGVVVTGITTHIYFRYHIEGTYDFLQMACDCEWTFKDGQIWEVTEAGRDQIGTYTRSGSLWTCRAKVGKVGDEIYMESSWLGIRFIQENGAFLPRKGFSPFAATLYNWHIRI